LGETDQKKIEEASQSNVSIAPNLDCQTQDLGSRMKIKDAKGLIWYPAETDVSIRPGWFYHTSQDEKVKTPEKLLDIYFSSVGCNSVLLLNIPPDRRGLLHENDVKAMKGLRSHLDKMYALNFASNAKLSSEGKNAKGITDHQMTTFWTTKGGKESGTIDITLPQPQTVDVLCLQENITIGQRIEKFRFEYKNGEQWVEAAKGTTVGYKRLLRFNPVKATEFRLIIEASRLNPTISELGLYQSPVEQSKK
jgi:alpha-L-fucosidase